ncbi:MAG: FAD-dependent oxidoreductase [Clostridiales Family XIII bacterium]|jgi:2,4-dienoyl-CoA reductase-like NADH-dependent reductase (Old Yellow Enzyme family)/thioredoxin reductase|nr:FAD-dependent oxidoreductase [Clostridiales Family XIII bacterium]
MGAYERLLSPGRIGDVEIKNRLVVGPMVTCMNPGGLASEQWIRYHEEKAKGGWGLIITEDYRVNEHAGGYPHIAGLYNEEQVESHKKLTEAVHRHGAKIFAQIYHAGRETNHFVNGGVQPVSCSPIPCPFNKEIPHELTVPEIRGIVRDFANTAANAKRAGFDGVEIHGAHGYLVHQFLTPYANKRIDEYGGTHENRLRFLREVIEAVRAEVGAGFPIQVRVSANDAVPGGRTSFASHRLYRDIESFGADSLHVSYGIYGARPSVGGVGMYYQPQGFGAQYAAEAKRYVDIPVIAVGSIHDPAMAEEILAEGDADFITMARMSLADPQLPNKVARGASQDIRPCVRCLQGCIAATKAGVPIACLVNPEVGHEHEYDYGPAAAKKKVFVAGGGVAGMEAARAARMKGHDVTIFESSGALGGQFLLASYPPAKGEFSAFPAWQKRQIDELGVEVRLNTTLTPEMLRAEKPDKLIVATGARPIQRPHKGGDGPNVAQAIDVLAGRADTGLRVLVAGGGLIGSEVTTFIAAQYKQVAVTTRQADVGSAIESKEDLKDILEHYAVRVFPRTSLVEVTTEGAKLATEGKEWFYPCDTVVTAFGMEAYDPLSTEARKICETVVVGDAREARTALEATREGFVAGLFA